ncbi:hypothetical protein [Fodinicurvata sediminis]|uniref:hypothetical protein n=1 Tax=Fodinicurvata sediminis TaxID=1121832 RepID=UPI0003B4AF2D|nr:hypothetical protein [Fodinicurvata sediminis]
MKKRQTANRIILRGFGIGALLALADSALTPSTDFSSVSNLVLTGVLMSAIIAIDSMEGGG